ncbi:MAG: hypothetical protein QG650_324 [Patescibacteria group bacterium]|nr:hypothetical protein [Patescibacteria group bacterium]
MELSRQTRTNAAIAYFFLGPIFLLASRNPHFADPFVRAHAKAGTKAVAFYLAAFFVYVKYLSGYLSFSLPFFPVTASRLASAAILALMFATLLRGTLRANAGKLPAGTFEFSGFSGWSSEVGLVGSLSETERTLALMSFVPLFGIVVAARKKTSANVLGCRAGSLFFTAYALLWMSGGDAVLMVATLAYAIFFVTVGVTLFSTGKIPFEPAVSAIPSLERLWTLVRTVPTFFIETLKATFGKTQELSFAKAFEKISARDRATEEAMDRSFAESSFPISPKLAALPGVNLLFLPRLLSASPYRYAIAAGQGIAITAVYAGLAFWYGFGNPYQIFLLPAIALVLGNVEVRPFYRIPVLYELYSLVGILSFGLVNRARKMKETSEKETSVSFKV